MKQDAGNSVSNQEISILASVGFPDNHVIGQGRFLGIPDIGVDRRVGGNNRASFDPIIGRDVRGQEESYKLARI